MISPSVALIAPYAELADTALDLVAAHHLPVSCHAGDLQAGVHAARVAIEAGAQVIVSRGGTALAIRKAWDGPVVEISVSAYDVLRALHQARTIGSRIGLVGFSNVVLGAHDLGSILGMQIEQVRIQHESSCKDAVHRMAQSGIEVVVGDQLAVRTAAEYGIPGVLVLSGREAVLAACQEALRLVAVRIEEQTRAARFRTILEAVGEGIIAVDRDGRITLANAAATRLLGYSERDLIGQPIDRLLPDLDPARNEGEQQGRLLRQGSLQAVASIFPSPTGYGPSGAVIILQEVQQLQRVESRVRKALLARGHVARTRLEDIVTRSPGMQAVLARARAFAALDSVVLITGETGTGKELVAQGLHNASSRREGPFVAINCAALPETLLDSELFGYVEGAFTDARKGGKMGLFEQAHRGTIFLDEIGELPLALQGRLLRVLQEREVMRIGDDKVIPVDVRVVAATNVDLAEAVQRGQFRADLYYRLNVLPLHLPPLRERPEDIAPLAAALLARLAARHRRPVPSLSAGALARLQGYRWPGNVRELENVMERLLAIATGSWITEAEVAAAGLTMPLAPERFSAAAPDKEQILSVLRQYNHNRTLAARHLGISRSTLWRYMRELNLL